MQTLLADIPWYIKYPAGLAGAALTNYLGQVTGLQPWAFIGAIALAIWVALAFAWHSMNVWRVSQGRAKVELDPSHIIAFGFVIVAAGFIWQALHPAASKAQIAALQTGFNQLVNPRKLTPEQVSKFENFLLPRAKQKVEVIFDANNSEANAYAAQIYEAFSRAQWDVRSLRASTPNENLVEGLSFKSIYPINTTTNMQASNDVRRAFEIAGIPLGGSGASRNGETNDVVVVIYVGHKIRVMRENEN